MKIQLMNKIAKIGTDRFGAGFTVSEDITSPDAMLVRSASLLDCEFGEELLAIARAGIRSLRSYYRMPVPPEKEHFLVVNYSGLTEDHLTRLEALLRDW